MTPPQNFARGVNAAPSSAMAGHDDPGTGRAWNAPGPADASAAGDVSPTVEGYARERAPHWREAAVCLRVDPDLWFPEDGCHYDTHEMRAARAVCWDSCPVRKQCLDDALAFELGAPAARRFGIWGGLDPRERAKLDATSHRTPARTLCPWPRTTRGLARHAEREEMPCSACREHLRRRAELRERDRRIRALSERGFNNAEIAQFIGASPETVRGALTERESA